VPPKKHDWNNLQNYIFVHDKILRQYASCFSNQPQYNPYRSTPYVLELSTVLRFHHKNLKLEIDKVAEVQVFGKGRESARTYSYTYNVSDSIGNFFRYCSPHDHRPYHHKHTYDSITRVQIHPPQKIGDDDYPHIDQVIDELLAL
jgi:hypothetical protein